MPLVLLQVIEDIGLKQRIFADLEAACSPTCILSTNTSTIDINLVGAKTRSQVGSILVLCAARTGSL